MFPLVPVVFIAVGVFGFLVRASHRHGTAESLRTATRQAGGDLYDAAADAARTVGAMAGGGPSYGPHVSKLALLVNAGTEPPDWLVSEAVAEALAAGDAELVTSITRRFGDPDGLLDPAESVKAGPDPGGETVTVSGKNSPLDGVSNPEWEEFVSRLSTEGADFRTDRHVGAYRQSRARLQQLGVPEPTTPEEQYEALVADITNARDNAGALIRDWMGTELELGGGHHVVTASGILGLVKAAGLDGARSWLSNPGDRERFPHTTATFTKTNGVF